ncbi:MAG: hypothetical protein JF888_13835 [Candidatus Dormibacteraeota bacterium]|uniref:Uncharacterized protein n=1 Tax=Candidatus Dormiibacter inghamiae TaxID=3127013 RepID=A0A934NEU9_9BACT|nr:hypothetical protein [Candidatus Dormibacteraeota bacterium]MBJ7606333.1 hypothetical protein [Candidatus Dormibacteraeota bacterium]
MPPVTRWSLMLAVLLGAGLLLAWADATVLNSLFPQPVPTARGFQPRAQLPFPPGRHLGADRLEFRGLGSPGSVFSFGWFLATGAVLLLLTLAMLALASRRARLAAERVSPRLVVLLLAAGISATLLILAATELLRATFLLLSLVPIVWAASAVATLFGCAALALAAGRWLRGRLGGGNPWLGVVMAILIGLDAGLVPFAGWLLLLAVGLTGLGLAVVTRLGSAGGWNLEDLNW